MKGRVLAKRASQELSLRVAARKPGRGEAGQGADSVPPGEGIVTLAGHGRDAEIVPRSGEGLIS